MAKNAAAKVVLSALAACSLRQSAPSQPPPDLSRYVDLLIGTLGHGNALPGPCLPHGMVKLSPDSFRPENSVDSYEYGCPRIEGFSHTHLEGPGGSANGYSQILLMPQTRDLRLSPEDRASRFSHEDEVAQPGYYAVTLTDADVRVELTATEACGVHRYTFPANVQSRLFIDAGHTRGLPIFAEVFIVNRAEVEGLGVHQVNPLVSFGVDKTLQGPTGISKIYFSALFSRPADSYGVADESGVRQAEDHAEGASAIAWLEWAQGGTIEVRVGISFISIEQARANRQKQCEGKTFEEIRSSARNAWNRLLSRVQVSGGSESDLRLFYTSLYRALMQPANYTEDGRFFIGADGVGRVITANGRRFFTDDWCIWDTFRTTHPLQTLVEPEVVSDMVQSLVWLAQEGGFMPKCTWNALGDSRVMTGNPQFCVVADALTKGFRDYDLEGAWQAILRGSMEDEDPIAGLGMCGYLNRGTPKDYIEKGYVPRECDVDQSASMTLEYAYADWCAAKVAEHMGRHEEARYFLARSKNYRNVFNPKYGLMQQKNAAGDFVEPFDPTAWGYGFTEASSWEYTFFVPHDICGLADLMGGTVILLARLDEFFSQGLFHLDNEPDFQVPWMYTCLGAPSKTQALVFDLMDAHFDDTPAGLPGNDDAGATSAWFVFAAMGLYPVTPGDQKYWLSTPLFERIVLDLTPHGRPGKAFVIEAPGVSRSNRFIQAAALNGNPLDRPYIWHHEIVQGGHLALTVGPQPSGWGTFEACPLQQ